MSLHYQSTNGLQGVVKTNKGIEIKNARLNVKNATPGLSFNGSDELVNEWYSKQAGSDVDMGSNKITNLGAPSQPQDATSKNYVDSLAGTPALKDSLRAYYSFDGDYKDSTTNNYDGTPVSGTAFNNSTAVINQSLEFTSDADRVDVGQALDFNSGDFSISCWIYPNSASNSRRHFLGVGNTNTGRWSLAYGQSDDNVFALFTENSGGATSFIKTSPNFPPNQWHHFVLTRTGTTAQIWVNGGLSKDGTVSSGDLTANNTGYFGSIPGTTTTIDGYLDEVGAWSRVLSPGEILHLYNNGNGNQYLSTYNWYAINQGNHINMNKYRIQNAGDPIDSQDVTSKRYVDSLAGTPPLRDQIRAYYSFDGNYKDSTANNYHGAPLNGASIVASPSKIGSALSIAGGGSQKVVVNGALDFKANDFTVSGWIYNTNPGDFNPFIDSGDDGNSNGFYIAVSASDNLLLRTIDNNGNATTTGSSVSIPGNQWVQVSVTRSGGDYKLYKNGQYYETLNLFAGDISTNTDNQVIGYHSGFSMDGYVDELGIWDRVLSEQEILHLYNNGAGNQYLSTYDWYAIKQSNHINMNEYRITNMGEALNGSDAVDKNYVDSRKPMSTLYTGAIAYYKLDNDYTDSIGSYDGVNNGTSFTGGKLNQAVKIDGTQYVDTGDAWHVQTGDFTISLWYYAVSDANDNFMIWNGTSGQRRFTLDHKPGTKVVQLFADDGSSSLNITTSPINLNQWYFITLKREGDTATVYINSQLEVSGSLTGFGSISQSGESAIGRPGGYPGDFLVDEVGSWDRALTENEIKYLYHEGSGTNDFVSYDYTMNYDVDMNQNQILNLGSAQTNSFTISDDAVKTVSPANAVGVMMISAYGGVVIAFYDVGVGATSFVQQYGTVFNDSGGTDLTGSTGTDGKVNISCNSGEIHIENRGGLPENVRILNIF